MPKSIILFERLSYLSVFLGVLSMALNMPTITKFSAQSLGIYPAVILAVFGVQILFIWLIARRRKNWARWIWIFVTIAGSVSALFDMSVRFNNNLVAAAAYYLVYIVSIAATVFLLTPNSRAWVSRPQTEGELD